MKRLELAFNEPDVPPRISRWAARVAEYRKRMDAVELEPDEVQYCKYMAAEYGTTLERAMLAFKTRRAASEMEDEVVTVFQPEPEIPEPAEDTRGEDDDGYEDPGEWKSEVEL